MMTLEAKLLNHHLAKKEYSKRLMALIAEADKEMKVMDVVGLLECAKIDYITQSMRRFEAKQKGKK